MLSLLKWCPPSTPILIVYILCSLCREAYKIACLGVTDGDWRILALEALEVRISSNPLLTFVIVNAAYMTVICTYLHAGYGS